MYIKLAVLDFLSLPWLQIPINAHPAPPPSCFWLLQCKMAIYYNVIILYTILHYTILHYTTLYYTLHCTTLHYTVLYTTLHYTVLYTILIHYTIPTLRLTLENSSFWLLQWIMVGWLEQANTLVTPDCLNDFSTIGLVPRITRLPPFRWPRRVEDRLE